MWARGVTSQVLCNENTNLADLKGAGPQQCGCEAARFNWSRTQASLFSGPQM